MVETVVVVAIATVALVGFLRGLSTGSTAVLHVEERVTAENVARSQLESTLASTYYPPPYSYPTIETPQGYTATSEAVEYFPGDPNIEMIVVTVYRDGEVAKTLEGLKAKR